MAQEAEEVWRVIISASADIIMGSIIWEACIVCFTFRIECKLSGILYVD